ncbi:membrane protein containing DUF1558 [Rhodopirellula islandica]|uniref:Membrane protein containing DUF1558 n=1 Tax=Rhodopirellula islandica TaxID=595434 RepID=A0A0J1B9P6_RHOIS|nr:ABC transporter ATP-binding protein [Rhodopirellula islandica]KLU03206.1 membrane protein containing DUF1558 [Rhodopirellula islandica]
MNRFSSLKQPRREPEAAGAPLHLVCAAIAGLIIPVLVVVFGIIAVLVDEGGGLSRSPIQLGTHLSIPLPDFFLAQNKVVQLFSLVGLSLAIAVVFCLAVWLHRRSADARSRRVIKMLHSRTLKQSLRRAEVEGAAAQRERARLIIGRHLPEVGRGLSLWYRSIPRSVLMLIGCVTLALLVNVWLAILAVISGVALWRFYAKLRNPDWLELSRFEIPQIRERLIGLIGDAPMMARLQAGGLADQAYEAELDALDRRIAGDDARRGRLWPVMMMAGGVAIAVMLLGLGLNTLQGEQGLSLPSALVLGLSLTGAALAAARLSELKRQLRRSSKACESVYLYLQPNSEVSPSEQRVGLGGLRDCVTMEDVSLQDSAGKAILRDLSLSLQPKSLVAFLGTEEVSTRALLELLMGFGRPHRGKVQIDGISLLDVHPQALAKNVMWIGPDGPLWEGSLRENLMAGVDRSVDNRDMVETLERLGIYERITRLPEGLETIIEPGSNLGSGDDSESLGTDVRYAVGIARAMLHRPPIVLAKEPPAPTEHVNEDPCLIALRELADAGSLVVMLPHRLKTLRSCDRVMLLNGPNLVGEGRHTELLNSSDLYRHLNYLLFNPYRHRSPS